VRRFRSIGVGAVWGLGLTVGVAWLAALASPVTEAEFVISQADQGSPAPAPERWRVHVPPDWTIRTWLVRRGVGVRHDTVSESIWMGSTLGASESTNPNRTKVMLTTGWPLAALQSSAWDVTAPAARAGPARAWASGLAWRKTSDGHFYPPRNLPIRPVWWALAADAVLWGLAAWGTARGWAAMRRSKRRRRRQCERCGYPVADLKRCPECGGVASAAEHGPAR
jgi:hypothetical protein